MAAVSFSLTTIILFLILFQWVSSSPVHSESSSTNTQVGRGTWYEPGLGNCGWTNGRDQDVLAISKRLYDRNGGSNCGQWVKIVNTVNGRTAYGYIVDSCQSCADDDLDMSPALFQKMDSLSKGVITVSWEFLPKN